MFDNKKFTDKKFVAAVVTLCCLLWGSTYPGIKIGHILFNIDSNDIASKILFVGYRFVITGMILLIVAQISEKSVFSFSKIGKIIRD